MRIPTAFLIVSLLITAVPGESTVDFHLLQRLLDENFAGMDGGILVIRPSDGRILASIHSEEFFRPHPPGSLIKVYTVLAYYRVHGDTFPRLNCPPSLPEDGEGCWDRNGHGEIGVVRALAHSCNVYFRRIAREIDPAVFAKTLSQYRLIEDPAEILSLSFMTQQRLMAGSTNEWKLQPAKLLQAYCAFYNGGTLPEIYDPYEKRDHRISTTVHLPQGAYHLIRSGMGLSSAEGTSAEARRTAGVPVLGKTGTTLRWNQGHTSWRHTQGWWIGLHPATNPEVAIMTFVRNGRGATDAAPLGGKVLATYVRLSQGSR